MPAENDVNTLRKELEDCEKKNEGLREELEQAHTEIGSLTDEINFLRKKVASLQQDLLKQHNEFSRIESELYQQGQESEKLKKENVSFIKNKREVERKLREETLAYEKDRMAWQEHESEFLEQIKTLQETLNVLAQQTQEAQRKNKRSSSSPVSPTFGLNSIFSRLSNRESTSDDSRPSSPTTSNLHSVAREAKVAQKTIKEQDRLISHLKTEIEMTKSAATDTLNTNKSLSLTNALLRNELDQVKLVKRSLEEENEAFQLLLHEKTIKGEFMLNPVMQPHDTSNSRLMSPVSNKDTTFNVNRSDNTGDQVNRKQKPKSIVTNLAAELDRANNSNGEEVQKECDHPPNFEVQEEIKVLQDENKSLKLYINKILDRIMEAQGFEAILSADTDWSKKSNPSTPTSSLFNHIQANTITDLDAQAKKVERRKTLSSFPLRKTSPEKPSQIKTPVRSSTTISFADDCAVQNQPLTKSPTRLQSFADEMARRPHGTSEPRQRTQGDSGTRKRWSLWWPANEKPEEPKHDPYMRPMILVQEKEKMGDF